MKRTAPLILALAFTVAAALPARADVPPGVLGTTPTLAPMLKGVLPAVVNVSVTSKVEIQNPQQITMKNGKPAWKGTCPKCGNSVFRIGA